MLQKIWTIGSVSFRGFLPSKFKCDKRKERNEITFYPTITTPICFNKKQKMLDPLQDPLLLCVTFTPELFRSIPIQSGVEIGIVLQRLGRFEVTHNAFRTNRLVNLQFNDQRETSRSSQMDLWEIWAHHSTGTYLCRAACVCAGSWLPASWWRPCPGERWHCGVKAAGEPGRRTPPSLCCAGSEQRREISPCAAPSWSCKQKDNDSHTSQAQNYDTTATLHWSHIT